nr:ubiquitin specific peptidase 10 (C19 family) [Hymenolepis microstoma]
MTRKNKKSVAERNKQTSLNGRPSADNADIQPALTASVSPDEIELSLFRIIENIRNELLDSKYSASRTLCLIYPDYLPCPRYRLQPRGLVNARGICYLISSIQALFSLPPFIAILHQISVSIHKLFDQPGQLRNIWKESDATTVALLRLLLLLLDEKVPYRPGNDATGEPDIPHEFGLLSTQKPLQLDPRIFSILTFEPGQQDAGDCISRIITQLHEEMAALLRKFKPAEPANELADQFEDDGWFTVSTKGKKIKEAREARVDNGEVTPISLLFGGTLVTRSYYKKSPKLTEKSDIGMKERFFVLPLELLDNQIGCLEDCLKFLSKGEILNDFKDPETGQCVVMKRRVCIDYLPPVLMLQLNRFFYSPKRGRIEKVLKAIPIKRHLIIGKDIISNEHTYSIGQGSYELKAVIFHIGYTAERGHYTVATLSPESSRSEVLYFDDINVFQFGDKTETSWEDLFSSHIPFDVRGSQFRTLKPPSESVKPGPKITEQPRTPYILVTLPVLFIPGSQGNINQIRSIATIASELYLINKLNYSFEFFSLDFLEDSSAVSTEILERQSECVASIIPFIYSLFSKKSAPLLIIGHSMGGLVAHHALASATFDPSIVNTVLTIASPLKSPVISLGYNLQSFYRRVHDFWKKEALQPEYGHITYLSITGGVSDHLVWDGLGTLGLPSDRAFYLSTQAVNRVWLTCDHLCILWCKQLLMQINKAIFDIVNVTERMYLNSQDRIDVLKKILLSRSVPIEPPPSPPGLMAASTLSTVVINKRCKWINRVGGSSGVFFIPMTSGCTYLKVGLLSGHQNERLLLITNSVNVKGVYLYNNSTGTVPCNTLYKISEDSIQSIVVPANSSDNYRHRKLWMISFNKFKKDDRHLFDLDEYLVVVHFTYQMEKPVQSYLFKNFFDISTARQGSIMFDLIDNLDNRFIKSDKSKSRGVIDLPRTRNMESFFRLSLPVNDYYFGPSLPAPQIQIEPHTCSSDVDLYGIIIFSLPWDNQVYLYRFNPSVAESFSLQTVTPIPNNYTSLPSPTVDIIIDPRCSNKRVHIYYSYAHWIFQVLRVHCFDSLSLIVGHVLLSVFLLLVSNTMSLQKANCNHFNSVKHDLPNQDPGPNFKASEESLLSVIAVHYAVGIAVYLIHIIRLSVDDSSFFAILLPTSAWINKERQSVLGSSLKVSQTHSPLIVSPLFLLHSMCAVVIPVLIHYIADCHTPLILTLCGISRSNLSNKLDQLRSGLECRENLISFYLILASICVSGFIHDGAAFLLLSVGQILKSATTSLQQVIQFPIELALRLRFALLFILCSFLCVEQWITHFFRVKTFLAGFGFKSMVLYQSSFLQLLLLLHLLMVAFLFTPKTSPNRRRLSLFVTVVLLVASFLGCVACLGGYLNAADSLQACLAVVMPTVFSLYFLWMMAEISESWI